MFAYRWWTFFPGFKLGGDIEIYSGNDVALLLTPAGVLGFGIWDHDGWGTLGAFALQPSLALQILVADRFVHIWFRPVAFDFYFFPSWYDNRFNWHGIYSFLGGVFFEFG
jgi:hypothetical protein